MKDLNDIIQDDKAFEDLFAETMRKVGRERDKERIASIRSMSEEEFRKIIGSNQRKAIPLWPRIIRYSAAACLAGAIAVGGIQYNAYNKTTNLGAEYYAQVSSDISHMKGDASDELSALPALFANVAEGKDLPSTIAALTEAYNQSADETSDYNYVRNTIAWNLAMAHLKNNDRKAAKPILEKIIQDPDNAGKAIRQQAENALEELNTVFSLW